MECAERVEEALHFGCRHGEAVRGALVDDEHGAVLTHQPPHRLQDPDGIGQVVQHFDRHDKIVVADDGRIGGVADLESGPLSKSGSSGLLAGDGDGRLVEIEAVDLDVRIGPAMMIAAKPSPHPTSAIRTRSPAVSFACTSEGGGSHVWVRWLAKAGRVKAAWMSCRSDRPKAAPVLRRNSLGHDIDGLADPGTTAAHGFIHASLSSSIRTWAWAFGRVNRRSPAGLVTHQHPARLRRLAARAIPSRTARR
jgi:hypothetical protein